MQAPILSPHERVAALYSRVIHRVCQRMEQQERGADDETRAEEEAARERLVEAAARVEQRWRERMTCYTGYTYPPVAPAVESAVESANENVSGDDAGPRTTTATATATDKEEAEEDPGDVGNPSRPVLGRPHALMEQATPSSVFARMLNAKRKIDQLDGTIEDDLEEELGSSSSEALHDSVAEDEDDAIESDSPKPHATMRAAEAISAPVQTTTQTPALDVAPVAALNITRFPLQCSAQDVNFTFKKGILRGKWKNAVITLLRRENRLERIAPGHVLWLTVPPNEVDSAEDSRSRSGRLVEVVKAPGSDGSLIVREGRQDGPALLVHVTDTRRFHEYLVADCNAHFKFLAS